MLQCFKPNPYPTFKLHVSRGRVVNFPALHATTGCSLGDYNFAGPGWNSSQGGMAARPTCLFDFAAKIHDLHYCIHNLNFKRVGQHEDDVKKGKGDPIQRSLLHKADLIFRVMVNQPESVGFGPWFSRQYFAHRRADWARTDDGFVNIFNEPAICGRLETYSMIPYDKLPASRQSRRAEWRGNSAGKQPDFQASVPEDRNWLNWARGQYAAVWSLITRVR